MTLLAQANVAGKLRGEPLRLPPRRRRLSTIVKRHAPAGRCYIVSVHRARDPITVTDENVRLRKQWVHTLVGKDDVVLITVLPLGGSSSASGQGKSGLGIGLAVASIALLAVAPFAAPFLATSTGLSQGVIQAGLVIGGVALSYAAQRAMAAKKEKDQTLYSVSGGGNVPRPGERKPLIYGRCWTTPPLSQGDVTAYDGDTMVLTKRMTLGLGKFQIHTVRVGSAIFWKEGQGIQAPFNEANVSGKGAGNGSLESRSAIEFLYEQPSTLMPGDVISSPDVSGQGLPRQGENPAWTPWFNVTPPGVEVDKIQIDFQFPQGIFRTNESGTQRPFEGRVVFVAVPIDQNGSHSGGEFTLLDHSTGQLQTTKPLRLTRFVDVPKGRYAVKATNFYPEHENATTAATWDGLRGIQNDVRIRPKTTEITMRIRAGKGLTITAFSDVQVEATRLVPVWESGAWTEPRADRRAIWAYADLVRADYGLNDPDGIDVGKLIELDERAALYNQFNGVLPAVSSFWEAAGEVLNVLRCDPIKVGRVHSLVRDESVALPRHVLTRRQIIRDTGQASYAFAADEGVGDVIVEYDRDGDPKRPDAVRASIGPQTRTPKRLRINGVTTPEHAMKLARWVAATGVYRGNERAITVEWDGRLVYPGDHVLSDVWFLKGGQVFGVDGRQGNRLTLDCDANLPGQDQMGWVSIRTRTGREWGILRAWGVGARGLELHVDDVAAAQAASGRLLSQVLAQETQDPTTVIYSSDLTVLQRTFVVRSAVPSGPDQVRIEMVNDDPRVWQFVGEQVVVPQPVTVDLSDPLVPKLEMLRARAIRTETDIEVAWSVLPARGAVAYEVELSYDGATWEPISGGQTVATQGTSTLRQSENIVTVRARPIGRTGIPGEWISTTFGTIPPVVRGSVLEDASVLLEKLGLQVRREIEDINRIGQDALADAAAALEEARDPFRASRQALEDSRATIERNRTQLRNQILLLWERLEDVAAAAATEAAHAYERRDFVKLALEGRVNEAFVALKNETTLRIAEDEALASVSEALAVRLGAAEGAITTEASVRASALAAEASLRQALAVRVGTAEAAIITEQTTRAAADEAEAALRQALAARVGDAEAAIITEASARATADLAEASLRQAVAARVTDVESAITTEISARASADAAEAALRQVLDTRLGTAEAAIVTEQTARATADAAEATARQALYAQVTADINAAVSSEATARVNADSAEAAQRAAVNARVDSAFSTIAAEASTRASAIEAEANARAALESFLQGQISGHATALTQNYTRVTNVEDRITAEAGRIDAVQSTVGGHTATLTTVQQSINGVQARFGVGISFNASVGGFVINGFEKNDGSGWFSAAFMVDQFIITNGNTSKTPFAVINDRVIIPDLLVTSTAQIKEATIETLNVKQGAIGKPYQSGSYGGSRVGASGDGNAWVTIHDLWLPSDLGGSVAILRARLGGYRDVDSGNTHVVEARLVQIKSDGWIDKVVCPMPASFPINSSAEFDTVGVDDFINEGAHYSIQVRNLRVSGGGKADWVGQTANILAIVIKR